MMSQPRRLLGGLLLLAAVMFVYGLTMATSYVTNDVHSASIAAWRIASTGEPWLEDVDHAALTGRDDLWVGEATNGHVVSFRSPGPVAAAVPGYVVAGFVGATQYTMVPGSATAVLLTTAALALLHQALRPRTGPVVSMIAVGAFGLTTPVWSVSADSILTHPVTLLGIAGMAFGCARERWWLVGMFGGVALWGRLHTVVIVAVLGLGLAWAHQRPRIATVVGTVSACWLGLSLLWGRWVYGEWRLAGGYPVEAYADRAVGAPAGIWDLVANHAGFWIAPDRGLLVWTPVLLLLAPALVRSWPDLPLWSRWLVAGGLLYTLIQGQLNAFTGGSGFYGYRLSLELLTCLMPAYAMAVHSAGRVGGALLGPVLGLQFAVIAVGAPGDGGMLPMSEAWTNHSFIHAATEIPILFAWAIMMTLLGHLAAVAVRRRGGLTFPYSSRSPDAGDHFNRV